ncbi:unnamed protein product [Durusdinium trenchii]|uniref:Uncharacterized protein n=1 Tax=Durusdinium trenchii TaxID=1381693 RepID=A0ABP0MZZ0_9DINO
MAFLKAVLLASFLAPATAWYRYAQMVTGDVVKEAGNLTMGGKVGTYTVLIQVLNTLAGDLKLLTECCGDARPLAQEITNKVNLNEYEGNTEAQIKKEYFGEGKCNEVGLAGLLATGNPQCNYVYSFANKHWPEYEDSAMCVPSDVCSLDVAGATKGTKVGYTMVLQILNRNMGDLQYAGEGPLDACYQGMNMANEANFSFKSTETIHADVMGLKIPIGQTEKLSFIGLKQLDPLQMLGTCADKADTGVLYVFKNKFYNKDQRAVNISSFDYKLAMKKMREEEKKKKQEERAAMQEQRKYDREIAKAAKAAEAKIKEAEKEGKAKAEEVTEEVEKELAKLEGQAMDAVRKIKEDPYAKVKKNVKVTNKMKKDKVKIGKDDSAEDVQKALTSAADKAEEAVEEAKKKAEAAKDDAVKAADQAVQKATKDAAATAKKAKKSAQAAAEKAEESVEKIQKRRLDSIMI